MAIGKLVVLPKNIAFAASIFINLTSEPPWAVIYLLTPPALIYSERRASTGSLLEALWAGIIPIPPEPAYDSIIGGSLFLLFFFEGGYYPPLRVGAFIQINLYSKSVERTMSKKSAPKFPVIRHRALATPVIRWTPVRPTKQTGEPLTRVPPSLLL